MKHNQFGLVIMILSVLLSACGSKSQATPTTDPSLVLTSVAQTAAARLATIPTATPAPTATATITPTPELTATSESSIITSTLPTQTTPDPASTGSGTDLAVMVSDLTITDGTQIDPGAKFTKKWRLMNTGTSTWTTAYSLVLVSGDEISGPASMPLPMEVAPGRIIDVAVDLTAPKKDGKYTSYWKLKNANGQVFGVGFSGKDAFWVQIQVGGEANPAPTDTPAVTPGVATGTPSASVTNLDLEVDHSDVSAKCPHTFTYTASFGLSSAAFVTFHWEASDSTYTMPAEQSIDMQAGEHAIPFSFEVTSSNSGWLKFHITAPEDLLSGKVDFNLTCTS